ncbi:hypothetical protein APR50_10125 [Variovorax paradoxus]|nr:hypothetical protein APR49_42400 [Variovorax paradoxus]KPU95631.1 hypothetical protein APR52_17145 [Variovorax paradoxus]KPV09090.1 hypothetical protein APR50_10125 [Variovorax paradoxus]KPV22917.1 hypothetical protein APR51_08620 [Variovorax paradoxus]KPV33895.1 hypothetical protein APR48_08890 [Variovorax paradoxus]
MIGWWIVVAAQTPAERDQTIDSKPALLANWEVGPGGIDWLHRLVKAGKATQLAFSGYPNRFTAQAGDVLPMFADGPPAHRGPAIIGDDYVMPANWQGNVIFDHDKIGAYPPNQVLTIDAWDLS